MDSEPELIEPSTSPDIAPRVEPIPFTPKVDKEVESENDDSEHEDSEHEDSEHEETQRTEYVFNEVPDSRVTVVSINGVPNFYAKNREHAEQQVNEFITRVRGEHLSYAIYVDRVNDNLIEINRIYKYFIIGYEDLMYRIDFTSVPQVGH